MQRQSSFSLHGSILTFGRWLVEEHDALLASSHSRCQNDHSERTEAEDGNRFAANFHLSSAAGQLDSECQTAL